MPEHPMLGFVGLGQMGQPMALNLLHATRGARDLWVFDQRPERMTPLIAAGASAASDLGELAHAGGIVFSMVPDDRALLQIALGEQGLFAQLGAGGILVSCATVSPDVSRQLARLAQRQRGCTFLTATVLGRPEVAERGALSVLLAGHAAAKERVKPLLASMGTNLYDLGEQTEAATVAKIACNLLIAGAIEAMGEAAALVEAYHVERASFLEMVSALPLFQGSVSRGYGPMIGARDFSDRRFPVSYGLKDVELALQSGQHKHLTLPTAQVVHSHLLAA